MRIRLRRCVFVNPLHDVRDILQPKVLKPSLRQKTLRSRVHILLQSPHTKRRQLIRHDIIRQQINLHIQPRWFLRLAGGGVVVAVVAELEEGFNAGRGVFGECDGSGGGFGEGAGEGGGKKRGEEGEDGEVCRVGGAIGGDNGDVGKGGVFVETVCLAEG